MLAFVTPTELRTLRTAAGLTQAQLAARLGVSRVSIAYWETDKRPITPLAEIAIRCVIEHQEHRP